MSTNNIPLPGDPQAWADHEAIMRHLIEGTPVEPELARRVQERAEKITEEVRQRYGDVDVDALIRASRDEA